jgi:tetratricopeptide (TPR) repeat protein
LKKAVREADDFEVVYRARRILQSFELGIYADTPADTVALIGQFCMGDYHMRQVAAQRLKEKGMTDLLRRLIAKEPNPYLREQLNQFVLATGPARYPPGAHRFTVRPVPRAIDASELALEARLRLAQRDFDGAERLLRGAPGDASLRDYAALLLSRNKLDAAIAQLRVNLQPADAAGQRRLAWMLRAKGDLAGAVAAARRVNDNGLVEDLQAEMADWKELAKVDVKADVDALAAAQDGSSKLARIMVFRHLAGQKQPCDLAAAAAAKAVKQHQFRYGFLVTALILNDRVEQAIEASAPQDVRVAFELLVIQLRMKEAFRLVKIDVPIPAKIDWTAWLRDGKGEVAPERLLLAFQVGRALFVVGEDQRARELIAAMLGAIGEKLPEDGWDLYALMLMDLEIAVGRPETSDALAAKLLALDLKEPEIVISRLYRDQGTIAILLWKALRRQLPGEDRLAALKHLRRLVTGKPDATAVEELRRLAARIDLQIALQKPDDSPDDETSDPRARRLLALATLFHRYGQSQPATKYLARIGTAVSAQTLIDEGNLYAEEKQWNEAAKSYEAAWTKDRRSAAALYLLGWAQSKRGEEAEGRKRMELALMVPLADGESRHDLVQMLVRLHQDEEAARQRQWLLRVAAMHDRSIVQTLMETGNAAAEKADAAGTATVWQRVAVELLSGNAFLSETRYYFQPAAAAHSARARELLRAGKTAEAIEEVRQGEAVQPADIQLALDCAPELRKHGAAGEADALYRRMLQRHELFCRDFPRSGTCHNNLAWLAANLDRDLDQALAHAQRAVELEPQAAGILDTLAEVHFRRGNRAEAVRLAKRCLELEPDEEQFKKQLARFEAAPTPK